MYAEIILSRPSRDLDNIYHYEIPSELKEKLKIGSQVRIPFGRRETIGYVVGFSETTDVPLEKIRPVLEVLSDEPLFDESAVNLADWISKYYLAYKISCLRLIMPPGTRRKEGLKGKKKKRAVANVAQVFRPAIGEVVDEFAIKPGFPPTPAQQKALELIYSSCEEGKAETVLLYGITGSGKTEVYLQAIAEVLKKGKTAMALVPEVGLTPQLEERFRERFTDHIAIFHSGLTEKERRDEWERVKNGSSRIVLGTRLGLFAPLKNIGLIVLDEEYETTYKQEQTPKYHAREVAVFLSQQFQCPLILGSATPSIETFYKAKNGEYRLAVLPKRICDRPLPAVEIVDMRLELKAGNRGVLSRKLRKELVSCFKKKEQAILFINRIGFNTFVMCRECGFAIQCPHCSISLVYYAKDKSLRCAHCGYRNTTPVVCPNCESSSIRYFGTGTQRIEQEVALSYPAVRILRFDRDTITKKGSHEAIYGTFKDGKADLLIGTQLVTKGLDVAAVTLIGAVAADTALSMPDFRAPEHTFQLLTQVAGRAGRHHLPGKVIIQTYNPEHYVILAAAKHDYDVFYKEEIGLRQELGFPPFSRLINLIIMGESEENTGKIAEDLKTFLTKRLQEDEILGPSATAIPRVRGLYRFQILLKGKDLNALRSAVEESLAKLVIPKDIRIAVDVEPINIL